MTKKKKLAAIVEPKRKLPARSWKHSQLYNDVREAIACLPIYFRTETRISGIIATDLHTLNTVLGATIEEQVVRTMNLMRKTWDPDEKYSLYNFIRQPQTFPDVVLRNASGDIIMGIELKGWYLLAKEAEPSLRFQNTEAACNKQDLIVVVPWVLGNVISGSPILFEPYIESAKYAAQYRNYHWQHVRSTTSETAIAIPEGCAPYPTKSDRILDRPNVDGGGNFGRLARTGIMDTFKERLNQVQLCGIKTVYWRMFLKAFQESATDETIRAALENLKTRVQSTDKPTSTKAQSALLIIAEIERLLDISE